MLTFLKHNILKFAVIALVLMLSLSESTAMANILILELSEIQFEGSQPAFLPWNKSLSQFFRLPLDCPQQYKLLFLEHQLLPQD